MSVQSMTGFGQAKAESGSVELSVELKSVNHRFLDVSTKLPAQYSQFEASLSKLIRSQVRRGRVDVYVSRKQRSEDSQRVALNEPLYEAYVREIRRVVHGTAGVSEAAIDQVVANVLSRREVLDVVPVDEDVAQEEQLVLQTVKEALENLIAMRGTEGAELEKELLGRTKAVEDLVNEIRAKVAETPKQLLERLTLRLEKLLSGHELDSERLAQEVAYLADRADVTEELTRLESHIGQFRSVLSSGEGGRKLEFILQEMGREINTIGSKAQDGEVTALVVDGKAVLEKMREQVQNVE